MISRPAADPSLDPAARPGGRRPCSGRPTCRRQRPLPQSPVAPPEATGPGGTAAGRRHRHRDRRRSRRPLPPPGHRRAVRRGRRGPAPTAAHRRHRPRDDRRQPRIAVHAKLYRPSHYLAKFRDGGGLDWLPAGLALSLAAQPEHDRAARPGPAGVLGPRQGDRAAAQGRAGSGPEPGRPRRGRPPHRPGSADATGRGSTSSPTRPAAPAAACSSTWRTWPGISCANSDTHIRTSSACCCCRPRIRPGRDRRHCRIPTPRWPSWPITAGRTRLTMRASARAIRRP